MMKAVKKGVSSVDVVPVFRYLPDRRPNDPLPSSLTQSNNWKDMF